MSIPGAVNPLLLGGGDQEYRIERSLRFNGSADSAYLSRTPASAGNRKTWTWAGWVKRSNLGTVQHIFGNSDSSAFNGFFLRFFTGDVIEVFDYTVNYVWRKQTTQVFRDASSWYHLVVSFDTTNATADDRVRFYVNGNRVTAFSVSTNPSLNYDGFINNTAVSSIGRIGTFDGLYFNGYLADIHFIDGQALDPTSFAETNATTGQWVPKAYSGTYGTNGFRLAFADNSNNTATTLGKDSSPNGNNWTPNNLSVTAGAGNDSLVDTPTSYGEDDGLGGSVRGNYATLNPLVITSTTTLANGNLDVTSSGQLNAVSTIVPSSGKWYLEITLGSIVTNSFIGLYGTTPLNSSYCVYGINGYGFLNTGWGSASSTVSGTGVAGDVIGLALDVDAKTLQYYKNGSSLGTISGFTFVQNWSIGIGCNATVSTPWSFNFGQRPFAYTAPSGFKALCDTNLPAPVVAKPNTAFDVALWTGNGSARSITGLNFNPDFVWIKGRSGATDHALYDVVRGTEKRLESNTTDAEVTSDGGVTAFNSDGFSLGTLAQVNTNSSTYVGWAWDGGTSTVTNTQGSITSQVRANASAGFSIVTFTGTGSTETVGHGLGVAPELVIVKFRNNAGDWATWHKDIPASNYLRLNSTAASTNSPSIWNSTSPGSSVFTIGLSLSASGFTCVAYCFAPVAGYSAFGSYTGSGSSGPFIYTGFKPKWLLIKGTNAAYTWYVFDAERDPFNGVDAFLNPNNSNAESTAAGQLYDFLSNGFRLISGNGELNANGSTYVYACFAESPFQYARAR